MTDEKVSVIIPFYNNIHQVKKAIQSVVLQEYSNIEVIVIDDGSSKNYEKDILVFKNEIDIKYFKQKNSGPGLARQFGLSVSTGKYIQYLDSDDELMRDKILEQVAILNANPKAIMVYGLSQMNNDSKKIHRKKFAKRNEKHVSTRAIQKRTWHTSSCLWNYDNRHIYWEDLFNGEDVLHDVNAGLLNDNTEVIFHNKIVSNISMSDSVNHLSNAIHDTRKHQQLLRDAMELNYRILGKVFKNDHLKNDRKTVEALAERFFYEGLKFYKISFKKEGMKMLVESDKLTHLKFKKVEIILCKFLHAINLLNSKSIYYIFKVRRKILADELHQFRAL
ncbi:glycosyltransferase family A protein [Wenyingzhuangia sp. IMCC45533]